MTKIFMKERGGGGGGKSGGLGGGNTKRCLKWDGEGLFQQSNRNLKERVGKGRSCLQGRKDHQLCPHKNFNRAAVRYVCQIQ